VCGVANYDEWISLLAFAISPTLNHSVNYCRRLDFRCWRVLGFSHSFPPPPRPLPKLCVSLSTVITEESDCHCHYHYSHSVAQGLLSPAVAVVRSGTGRGFSALPVVWLCENIFAFIALHIIVID